MSVVVVDMLLSAAGGLILQRGYQFSVVIVEYSVRGAVALWLVGRFGRGTFVKAMFDRGRLGKEFYWAVTRLSLVGIVTLAALALVLVAEVLPAPSQPMQAQSWRTNVFWETLPLLTFASPIVEEVIYRGIVMPTLIRRMGPWGAVLVGSLLFAFLHAVPYGMGPFVSLQLFGGLVFGGLFAWRRSVLLCISIHAIGNFGLTIYPLAYVWAFDAFPGAFY